MTEGVIWKQLVLFAIPLIMGNVFQQLYNTVDSIVVGNYLGTSALAAVGATTAICNTLVNFFNGISIGAGVVISTSFGAKNLEKLHEAVETTILFAVIVGCFVSLISIGVVPVMLKWMSTPDDVVGPAGEYLKIYFVGVPVLFLYNMGSAILRAVGDTRRPLLFLIISSCLNIVLDILFVAVFHWGISGVAIATVMAETVSAFLACMTLTRTDGAHKHVSVRSSGSDFRPVSSRDSQRFPMLWYRHMSTVLVPLSLWRAGAATRRSTSSRSCRPRAWARRQPPSWDRTSARRT